jgi:hypothetical protein
MIKRRRIGIPRIYDNLHNKNNNFGVISFGIHDFCPTIIAEIFIIYNFSLKIYIFFVIYFETHNTNRHHIIFVVLTY